MAIGLSEIVIGLTSSYINPHAIIQVQSIQNYGDLTNVALANVNVAGQGYGQMGWINNARNMPLYKIGLAFLPRRAEIAEATFGFEIFGRSAGMTGAKTLQLHAIDGNLGAGTTGLLRATGVAWYGGGYGPAPGYDYAELPFATKSLTAEQVAALPATIGGGSLVVEFDCTAATQYRRDAGEDLQFIMPITWASSLGVFYFDYHENAIDMNAWFRVRYWPAIGVVSSRAVANRPPDFTQLHNRDLAGNQYRTWLDVVEQGSAGADTKPWAVNFRRSGKRRAVVVGTSRAEHTSIDQSGAGSGVKLLSVDCFDFDTTPTPDEATPPGDWTIEAISTNQVQVRYTDEAGVTTTLSAEGGGGTDLLISATTTLLYNGKRALRLRPEKWVAAFAAGVMTVVTTGLTIGDKWRFSTRHDPRTTESIDTLGLVKVCPPTAPWGNTADTAKARVLKNAYTQQLRAPAYNQDVGGVVRTHLPIRDTGRVAWLTGAAAFVDLFSSDSLTVLRESGGTPIKIETVYNSTHGSYPDTLRLNVALTAGELATMNALASVTGGVFLGDIARFQLRRLASAALVGQNQFSLDTAFEGSVVGKQLWLVETTGANEIVTVESGTSTITTTTNLAATHPQGTLVFLNLDPTDTSPSNQAALFVRPFFVFGEIPTTQLEGLYSGFYVLFEQKVVS